MIPKTMRALKIDRITAGEEAHLTEIPVPAAKPGWVLVKVEAFGLNNAEKSVRLLEIGSPWIARKSSRASNARAPWPTARTPTWRRANGS